MGHRIGKCFVIVAMVVGIGAAHASKDECASRVTAKYRTQERVVDTEYVDHIFAVEVTSDEDCANVTYQISVEERDADGKIKTHTKSWTQRCKRGQTKTRKVEFRLHRDIPISRHQWEVTGCRPCSVR